MEALSISGQADNSIPEAFYLEVPLRTAVERLGELQVPDQLRFGKCGVVAGVAS